MSQITVKTHWDKVISDLEARLVKAKAVRDALGDPELADEIIKSLGVSPRERTIKRRILKYKKKTHVNQITAFFTKRQNEWADSFEIADGTGLKREAVRQVLYKGGREFLERRTNPNDSRKVQFRVKEGSE